MRTCSLPGLFAHTNFAVVIRWNSKTAVIACISPAADSAEETLSTLQFAARATHIRNRGAEGPDPDELHEKKEGALERAAADNVVDLSSGGTTISIGAGEIHCYGDWSAGPGAPVVLMLHYYGFGGDASMWVSLVGPLVAEGYRVMAPSMPGHGKTAGKSSSRPEDFGKPGGPLDIVLQLLDYCGVKKALLVGYDWGGGIACAFGLQHPNRMSKLLGWCVSYRNIEELKPLQRRGKQGDVCMLWEKNDPNRSYKKGQELAATLGVPLMEYSQHEVLKFLRRKK